MIYHLYLSLSISIYPPWSRTPKSSWQIANNSKWIDIWWYY